MEKTYICMKYPQLMFLEAERFKDGKYTTSDEGVQQHIETKLSGWKSYIFPSCDIPAEETPEEKVARLKRELAEAEAPLTAGLGIRGTTQLV